MNRREALRVVGSVLAASTWKPLSLAQGTVVLTPLSDQIMVLSGAGGNITIVRSPEGFLLLDSGLPTTTEAVTGKLKETAALPVKHLINTHWHNDHTGGNVALGETGAHIMAHENCAKRLSITQHMAFFKRDVAPLAAAGLPKETFKDGKSLSFGGQSLECKYFPPAHTDTDATVHFKEADIYTTGDLFFNGWYPFIDYSSGGSIEGMIRNAAAILKIVGRGTKIVPGHGPVGTKAQLQQFHDMLADMNDQISKLINSGKTQEQVLAAAPTQKYDAKWGGAFLKPASWVSMLYQGKTAKESKAA